MADLWTIEALVLTKTRTGSPTSESRKGTQPKRSPTPCIFYTEMCIFGHIFTPISWKPELYRHCGLCGLCVASSFCKAYQVASSRKSALGKDRPVNYPTPNPSMLTPTMFKLEFLRNQSFPGMAGLWAVMARVWTTNPTGSTSPESRKGTQHVV